MIDMNNPYFRTAFPGRGRFYPSVALILPLTLSVVASACKQNPSSPQSGVFSKQPLVLSPAKTPIVPAPELTTLAPAPISSALGQPQPKTKPSSAPSTPKVTKPSAYQSTQAETLALPPKPSGTSPKVPIRVAIAREADYLVIGTSTPATVMDQNGQLVKKLPAQFAENFVVQGGQLQVGSASAPAVVWVKPASSEGLIYVSGRWYRGAVQVIANNGQLLGVNHLDMESYLYSVVGAEMPPSWPLEALKSQAIAARSYALAHVARPSNSFYDLGDTPRWQAYRGVETETHSTLAAVEQTAGIVLSYNGAVVESLYAASDHIVRDVHKGFGMSQNGANQLAQRQYSFQQILAHFYPGTRLAWLQLSS